AGWTDQELWALSLNGLGGNKRAALVFPNPERDAEHTEMGWDGNTRITGNEINVEDLYDFVRAVRTYTGSARFSIAGGNHGTSFCPPGSEGVLVSCDEIAAGTQWLDELNRPGGADETYGPAQWMTIYGGSGAGDPAYAGHYRHSPFLLGADNRQFPLTYHNDLRLDPAIIDVYRSFPEEAE
ncbi:MAG: hypothetical protein ACRDJM_05340, partial [Actinomycetota bacterium]